MDLSRPLGVMPDPTDLRQIFFTNLQLLGFEAAAMEAKHRIPFTRDMFSLPNKKGFEVVCYFLFHRLDSSLCKEQFRDCWPITDKKQEQLFRKAVNNWLAGIAKEEPHAHLPRIVASLFLSPGGNKFYQLMFAFTRFVLFKVVEKENGLKVGKDFLNPPVLTPQTLDLGKVMGRVLQSSTMRHRKRFLDHVEQARLIQHEWTDYANDLVKTHRSVCKAIREVEKQIKAEIQKATDRMGDGVKASPVPRRRSAGSYDGYDYDVQSVKRAQKVQKVRDLWKLMEEFHTTKAAEREVVESILQGTLDKYRIDAAEINVKVPDLLLRECEKELTRRNVDNTFEGGKLNLLSLIQLWNLSLHLYLEKLHQVGVPNFEEFQPRVAMQVHTQHAHLTNVQSLRTQLNREIIPELKRSIDHLRKRLDDEVFGDKTPQSIRTTTLGLGLLPPTPPVSFTPDDSSELRHETISPCMTLTPEKAALSTPEAASRLADSVSKLTRKREGRLGQGSPVYAPKLGIKGQPEGANNIPQSRLPVWQVDIEKVGNKQRTRIRSAPSKMAETSIVATPEQEVAKRRVAKEQLTSQASSKKSAPARGIEDKVFKAPTSTVKRSKPPTGKTTTPRGERQDKSYLSKTTRPSSSRQSTRAEDILVEQITSAIMDGGGSSRRSEESSSTTSGEAMLDFNLNDPLAALASSAFVSQDKIARTPAPHSRGRPAWQDSPGHAATPQYAAEVDQVKTQLFTDDDENGKPITVGEIKRTQMPALGEDAISLLSNRMTPSAAETPRSMRNGTPRSTSSKLTGQRSVHGPTLLDMDTIFGSPPPTDIPIDDITVLGKSPLGSRGEQNRTNSNNIWDGLDDINLSPALQFPKDDDLKFNLSPSVLNETYDELMDSKTPELPKTRLRSATNSRNNSILESAKPSSRNTSILLDSLGINLAQRKEEGNVSLLDLAEENDASLLDDVSWASLEEMGRHPSGESQSSLKEAGLLEMDAGRGSHKTKTDILHSLRDTDDRVQHNSFSLQPENSSPFSPHMSSPSSRHLQRGPEKDLHEGSLLLSRARESITRMFDKTSTETNLDITNSRGLPHERDTNLHTSLDHLKLNDYDNSNNSNKGNPVSTKPATTASDIFERFRKLNESKLNATMDTLNSINSRMDKLELSSSKLKMGDKTPEEKLNEKYLRASPQKDSLPEFKKFTLDFDDYESDDSPSPAPVRTPVTSSSTRGSLDQSPFDVSLIDTSGLLDSSTLNSPSTSFGKVEDKKLLSSPTRTPVKGLSWLQLSPTTHDLHIKERNHFERNEVGTDILGEDDSILLGEDDSILLPTSPFAGGWNASPQTGHLLDI